MTQDKFKPLVECAQIAVDQLSDNWGNLNQAQIEIMAIQLERLLEHIQPHRKESNT